MLLQFITNIFCLSEPGEHILHRVGDLWREKTTEFSSSLRTSKIWFGSLPGTEQPWLRSPAAACAQKGHQDRESETAETPRRPFLLPVLGHPSDPQLNSNPRFHTLLRTTALRLILSLLIPLVNTAVRIISPKQAVRGEQQRRQCPSEGTEKLDLPLNEPRRPSPPPTRVTTGIQKELLRSASGGWAELPDISFQLLSP